MLRSVLIVDDSSYMRALIRRVLEKGDYRVIAQAATGEEAIDLAFDLEPDIITLDNTLPDMIGVDILQVYIARKLPSKVVMISALGQKEVKREVRRLGAKAYVVKPFTAAHLLEVVDSI